MPPSGHRRGVVLLLSALLLATFQPAEGADPQPYDVTVAPSGVPGADAPLRSSSNLVNLRQSSPVGPFALVLRASDDAGRMKSVLGSFGYYDAAVDIRILGRPLDDPGLPDAIAAAPATPAPVAVTFRPGPQYHLRHVTLTGDVAPEARNALRLREGEPALAADVLAAQSRMLAALQDSGHPLAKVATPAATLVPGEHALDVSFQVASGPRADIGPITLSGLGRVNESYVRHRLLVHPGELYSPAEVEKARQDLVNTGVFSTVRITAANRLGPDGTIPLHIETTERLRHTVGFTAAYSTDLGASAGVTFQYRNVFGNAERLDLGAAVTQLGGTASRGQGYNVTASLTKPDWLVRDQSITGNLQAIKENLEAYDRTAFIAGVSVSRRFSDIYTASAGLTATEERVLQEGVTRNYTLLAVPLGLRVDTTGPDGLLSPTKGFRVSATATPTQSLTGTTSTFTILQLTGSTYINLAAPGRSVLALRATLGSVQGAGTFDLPPDQRFYAGGSATVRGYKFQSIGPLFPNDLRPTGGASLGAGTVEFRQRFGSSFGAAVFVDTGSVSNSATPFSDKLRTGAGVGARYYTAIGPIRLDVALPLQRRRGDDSFELYIGIGEAF